MWILPVPWIDTLGLKVKAIITVAFCCCFDVSSGNKANNLLRELLFSSHKNGVKNNIFYSGYIPVIPVRMSSQTRCCWLHYLPHRKAEVGNADEQVTIQNHNSCKTFQKYSCIISLQGTHTHTPDKGLCINLPSVWISENNWNLLKTWFPLRFLKTTGTGWGPIAFQDSVGVASPMLFHTTMICCRWGTAWQCSSTLSSTAVHLSLAMMRVNSVWGPGQSQCGPATQVKQRLQLYYYKTVSTTSCI